MRIINTEEFNQVVTEKAVLLDLYADWCGPCVRTAPVLEDIAKEYYGKIVVYKVDVDKCGKIAQVRHIPEYADNANCVITGLLYFVSVIPIDSNTLSV